MNNKIKNILLKLKENNYEAYIVGGFVRDYLLGIETFDVDIATNAKPKEIKKVFDLVSSNVDNYGCVSLKDSLYNYDITTYRKEITYENRKPVEFEYISSLEEDIKRRDFTINALYMNELGEIFDIVNGKKDLDEKIVRVIGNIEDKMIEDPLRMMRAIRFAALLDFKIEDNLFHYIKQNKQMICTLSYTRKKEELDLIFESSNKLNGIQLIKDLNLEDVLEIKLPNAIIPTSSALGIWAQIETKGNYTFKSSEFEMIEGIRKVCKYGTIDNIVLYECGIYICKIAGEILGIDQNQISDIYKNLPIYSPKDLAVDGNDIQQLLKLDPGSIIKEILFDLEINILNGSIENNYESIKKYLITTRR